MDIGDIDLEGIEQAYADKGKGYVLQEQVILLKESIIKACLSNQHGISFGSHNETQQKFEEPSKKTRRKTNKHKAIEVGKRLVE